MKYMIQVRFNGADAAIRRLPGDEQNKITAEFEAVRALSGVLDGNQLEAAGTAKTVRVNDGKTLVADGAAVDEIAAIDGYYLLEVPDLETAIGFAARIPVARMGGTVEVRALMERG
jgi:hypothetical protein